MGESKRALTAKEIHELVDARVVAAMKETGMLLGVIMPDLVRSLTADENQRRAFLDRLAILSDDCDQHGRLAAAALGIAIHQALSTEPSIL